ncbi:MULTISPECIES: hypothetical protein [Stenotrophomonas]|uniref:hypothetical protein n=1 Tax=Stenotrophomonas TaxID=40323 RepID=UPI00201CE263|nr:MULTISPECIES: hypothetical protein [Stenotrophomonas]MDH1485515.1 hypothetical protein [Stenotrophomonas sp. GD03712]UQY96308.1 hypothetical protein LZ605_02815 [Stenotrophomonas maltophilia]HDS1111776.1 hypothetical protein [Stenotrophomonas maltophilia]
MQPRGGDGTVEGWESARGEVCVEETGNVSHCRRDSRAFDSNMVKPIDDYGQSEFAVEHTQAFCLHIRTYIHTSTQVEVARLERSDADTMSAGSSQRPA